jgi:phosphatidylglycerophosphate synthase
MSVVISKAVLLTVRTETRSVACDAVYGGETLLNRALVALSKSGIRMVKIICPKGQPQQLETIIDAVRKRLRLTYEIWELQSTQSLSENIIHVVKGWDERFLIFAVDKIVHPSLFQQALQLPLPDNPVLFAYKDVWIDNGKVCFAPSFTEKFKVIFHNPHILTKIAVDDQAVQSARCEVGAFSLVTLSPNLTSGAISLELAVCAKTDLQGRSFLSLGELFQGWSESKRLTIGFLAKVWWLPITGQESDEQITEFFWKIAFKEISGEFSKLVNSKLSKPMTFLFVRHGFSPNAISLIELVLFLLSSSFLLIEQYWAMLVFACLWQFAAGVLDRCDGETARVRNYESDAGARFDMAIDDLRFGFPFLFLTIACYRESRFDPSYIGVALVTFAWYFTAVIFHNRFLRRAGYVSIQTMGVDFLKAQEGAWLKIFRKIQPFTKGDIRTFYIFLLTFLGRKNVLFWTLVAYAWPLGASYFFTIKNFRLPTTEKT